MLTFCEELYQLKIDTHVYMEEIKKGLGFSKETISRFFNRRIFNQANAISVRLTSFPSLVSHGKTYGHLGIVNRFDQSSNIVVILQGATQCSSENGGSFSNVNNWSISTPIDDRGDINYWARIASSFSSLLTRTVNFTGINGEYYSNVLALLNRYMKPVVGAIHELPLPQALVIEKDCHHTCIHRTYNISMLITFKSEYFDCSGYTPAKRCKQVTRKINRNNSLPCASRSVICMSTVEKCSEIKRILNSMIFNERQYITTKARINEFGKAIAKLETNEDSLDPNQKLRKQVHLDALNSQLEELQEEITEYEALKTGDIKGVTINSFEEWPEVLIKARIARGWSQEQFANILEVHPQQIQRDESTRYAGSSLRKIIAVQKALGITVREEVTFN
jgi:DNA-binding XRE family transcriptional regulator